MKSKFSGYVIDSVDYKDNDSIVTVLCKDGLVSLKARGVKKINSKNASSVMNYAYSEFEVNKSNKNGYLTLSEGKLINYPSFICENLEYISVINFISEGIEKIDDKKDSFSLFVDCLDAMKSKYNSDYILVAFLNYFIEKQGCKLNSDECVSCSSKEKIVRFSFESGGFLCKKCCNTLGDDIEYLKNMRVISKINFTNIDKVSVDSIYVYKYIKEVVSMIENKVGIYFKSKSFLLRVLKREEI
jgi:DNA repair protein RecO (recombination protein O)